MATSENISKNKRQRKANYCNVEVRVLLEEVMLAKGVLFSAVNTKLTLKVKSDAWDKVTSAVNACGIAQRTRAEVKEKWKSMKCDFLNREKRVMQTPEGPPESPVHFEETIQQIIGHESNLCNGVTVPDTKSFDVPDTKSFDVPDTKSFDGPSALSQHAATESSTCWSPTVPAVLELKSEESVPNYQHQSECSLSETFNQARLLDQPLCESIPCQPIPATASADSFNFLPPGAGTTSLVVNPDGNISVNSDNDIGTGLPYTGTIRKPRRLSRRKAGGYTTLKSLLEKDFPSEADERAVFHEYMKGATLKNKVKIMLMETRNRRELLEIEKLEKELGKNV